MRANPNECPCGATWSGEGANKDTRCVKCGRIYTRWSNGDTQWIEDPTVVAVDRMYRHGQQHFADLHQEIYSLTAMVKDLRRFNPAWRKAQKRKAARRAARESK